jgi:hypothetical protein
MARGVAWGKGWLGSDCRSGLPCRRGRLAVPIDCSIPLVPAFMAGKGLQFEVRQIDHGRSARNRHYPAAGWARESVGRPECAARRKVASVPFAFLWHLTAPVGSRMTLQHVASWARGSEFTWFRSIVGGCDRGATLVGRRGQAFHGGEGKGTRFGGVHQLGYGRFDGVQVRQSGQHQLRRSGRHWPPWMPTDGESIQGTKSLDRRAVPSLSPRRPSRSGIRRRRLWRSRLPLDKPALRSLHRACANSG